MNGSRAVARSRDKLLSLQVLVEHGVQVPRTVVARNPSHLRQSLVEVGGPPVVLKLLQGMHGVGVMLAENDQALESVLDTLWSLGQNHPHPGVRGRGERPRHPRARDRRPRGRRDAGKRSWVSSARTSTAAGPVRTSSRAPPTSKRRCPRPGSSGWTSPASICSSPRPDRR